MKHGFGLGLWRVINNDTNGQKPATQTRKHGMPRSRNRFNERRERHLNVSINIADKQLSVDKNMKM